MYACTEIFVPFQFVNYLHCSIFTLALCVTWNTVINNNSIASVITKTTIRHKTLANISMSCLLNASFLSFSVKSYVVAIVAIVCFALGIGIAIAGPALYKRVRYPNYSHLQDMGVTT